MRSLYLLFCILFAGVASAQVVFPAEVDVPDDYANTSVIMPASPLSMQVLFVGGVDLVQTTPTYGNPAGETYAKEWHDFIGFTPDSSGASLGWVSVNHENIYRDDRIGDGGGMTVFRVNRDEMSGDLMVVEQTLEDGREGEYFNVDFVNTVGETGMNCGGVSSIVDGRIWTAEEWFRTSNASINFASARNASNYPILVGQSGANQGVRDTADHVVSAPDFPFIDGDTIKAYENFNWMVEIDPVQAKAIRKQYNFGRQGFEGGIVTPDNQYMYFGIDATPGFWVRFVADAPGDFINGTLQVYKHDADVKWIDLTNDQKDAVLNITELAAAAGGTMYNRNEWVAVDPESGIIYWTETGRDAPGSRFQRGADGGGVIAPHHTARAAAQTARVQAEFPDSVITVLNSGYRDYYGRVLQYDPATEEVTVTIEGGPDFFTEDGPTQAEYPDKHLSNPDGLNVMTIDGKSFIVICEDLNDETYGRMPFENTGEDGATGIKNRMCELYLLPTGLDSATVDDLIRITAAPVGAEITGAIPTPDGKSLLVNSQHPSVNNPFPYNHSLTFAINGFDEISVSNLAEPEIDEAAGFSIYPNPTLQTVFLNETQDVALYNQSGQRLQVYRNVRRVDVSTLPAGVYFLRNGAGKVVELVKQ